MNNVHSLIYIDKELIDASAGKGWKAYIRMVESG